MEVEPGKEVLESKVSFKWKKAFFYLFFLILGVLLLIQRGTSFWISKEIERSLSNDYSGYQINLKGVDSSLFSARVELMVKPTLSFRDVTLEEFETTAFVEFKTYRFLYDLYQNKRVGGKKVILLGSGYLRTRSDGLGNIGIEVFGRGRAKVDINWGRQVNFDSGSNLTKVIGPSKLNLEVSDQYVDSSYFAEYFSVYYPGGIIKANNV
ncbi:hypothetical protein, partial [Endozoicomonas atrinae]|uniref:hypothetical protein n=1 Tax=Endozoicomonas atrinae TaxID=1333660 RepID=UPI001112FE1C